MIEYTGKDAFITCRNGELLLDPYGKFRNLEACYNNKGDSELWIKIYNELKDISTEELIIRMENNRKELIRIQEKYTAREYSRNWYKNPEMRYNNIEMNIIHDLEFIFTGEQVNFLRIYSGREKNKNRKNKK